MKRSKKRLAKGAMTAGVVAVSSMLGAGAAGAAGAPGQVPNRWVREERPALTDALTESTALFDRFRSGPRCTPLPHGIPCDILQRADRLPAPVVAGPFPVGIPAELVVPVVPEVVDAFPHGIPAEPVAPAVPSIIDAFPHGIPAELVRAGGLAELVAPAVPSIVDAFPHGIPAELLRNAFTGGGTPGVDAAVGGSLAEVMPHGVPAITAATDAVLGG